MSGLYLTDACGKKCSCDNTGGVGGVGEDDCVILVGVVDDDDVGRGEDDVGGRPRM